MKARDAHDCERKQETRTGNSTLHSHAARSTRHGIAVVLVSLSLIGFGPPVPSVEGLVVDIVSREPIPGIVLAAQTPADTNEEIGRAKVSTVTDAAGRFRFGGLLPSRRYELSTDDRWCTIRERVFESPVGGQTRLLEDPVAGFCPADRDLNAVVRNTAIELRTCSDTPRKRIEAMIRFTMGAEDLLIFEFQPESCHLFLIPTAPDDDMRESRTETLVERLIDKEVGLEAVMSRSLTTTAHLPELVILSAYGCRDAGSLVALYNAIGRSVVADEDQKVAIMTSEQEIVVLSADQLLPPGFSLPEGCKIFEERRLRAARPTGM